MKDLQVHFSLKGRSCLGRWYTKTYRISIFLNRIFKYIQVYKKEYQDQIFMAVLLATEFHEIGHIKIDEWGIKGQPCNSGKKCNKGGCFWCEYTDAQAAWFMKEREI